MIVGFTFATETPYEVVVPAVCGLNRQAIVAQKEALIQSKRINTKLRAACWITGGALGLAACYTMFKDFAWFNADPTEALEHATRTVQEQMVRQSKISILISGIAQKLMPAVKMEEQNELKEQLDALVTAVRLDKPIEFKPEKEHFLRRIYNAAFYPALIGGVTWILNYVFQDNTLQNFTRRYSSFASVCKNIDQMGYVINAIKSAPHVYAADRLDMIRTMAIHAYNNLMRDAERVLGYIEFQLYYQDLKGHTAGADLDFVTFITQDFARSEQTVQQLVQHYEAPDADHEQKIASVAAMYEHILVYKNMFKLLLDNFERYEEQVALALE